jgi:hypothetical protein
MTETAAQGTTPTESYGNFGLRGQPFDRPILACPPVADPVVQAVRRFLPELDPAGKQPEAAPALGTVQISAIGVAELQGTSP